MPCCIGNGHNIGGFEFNAQAVVDVNSQKVFRGVAWSWSRRFTLPASAEQNIVIDPTAIPAGTMAVVLPVSFIGFGAGPINIDMYFGTTAAEGGTLWTAGNRDHRITTQPATVIRYNPNVSELGTKLPFEFMVPSDGVPANATLGGDTKDDLISIARTDGKYAFNLTNTEANPASCAFAITIFEVIPGVNNG